MIKIGNSTSHILFYSCRPKYKKELKYIIKERIHKEGSNCDLNDIDTSEITDVTELFYGTKFNGDISKWNVSNVENMACMFMNSKFKQDISRWDVSSVDNMIGMFAVSKFNKDISNWKINKDCSTWNMFRDCPIKEEYKPKSLNK